MATYKGIQGYSVQKLSSDPTASEAAQDNFFIILLTGKFKIATEGAGTWASGGNMNLQRAFGGTAGASNCSYLRWWRRSRPTISKYRSSGVRNI